MKPVTKTILMTKAQHKAWDKALRSGKIKQGTGTLRDVDGSMCCLGVLEYALEGKVEASRGLPSRDFLARNNIKFLELDPDDIEIRDSASLTPTLSKGNTADYLNDDVGLTFKQIAARIKNRVQYIPAKR